jgi:hypothetical protein
LSDGSQHLEKAPCCLSTARGFPNNGPHRLQEGLEERPASAATHRPFCLRSSPHEAAAAVCLAASYGDGKPRPREEAFRKLEERVGMDARRLFEALLRKIDKLEATALEAQEGEQ